MTMFYSTSTSGFYSLEIHGDNIPADAVEISAEDHAALLVGQSSGKIIVSDKNGYPVLQDPPPVTDEQMKQSEIQQDKQYLSDTDYIVLKISEASAVGQDTTPLLEQYSTELVERENARIRIRINQGRL